MLLVLERLLLRILPRVAGFLGTFPPARRASDRPIAIACFRLLTFLPDLPDLRVPLLRSCIAFRTFSEAFFPYRGMSSFSRFNSAWGIKTKHATAADLTELCA